MQDPRITDNDKGEITATINGIEIRGWSYKDTGEQRIKMLLAHEFAEGWWQAKEYDKFATPAFRVHSQT
jgi:hypothetical protein